MDPTLLCVKREPSYEYAAPLDRYLSGNMRSAQSGLLREYSGARALRASRLHAVPGATGGIASREGKAIGRARVS